MVYAIAALCICGCFNSRANINANTLAPMVGMACRFRSVNVACAGEARLLCNAGSLMSEQATGSQGKLRQATRSRGWFCRYSGYNILRIFIPPFASVDGREAAERLPLLLERA